MRELDFVGERTARTAIRTASRVMGQRKRRPWHTAEGFAEDLRVRGTAGVRHEEVDRLGIIHAVRFGMDRVGAAAAVLRPRDHARLQRCAELRPIHFGNALGVGFRRLALLRRCVVGDHDHRRRLHVALGPVRIQINNDPAFGANLLPVCIRQSAVHDNRINPRRRRVGTLLTSGVANGFPAPLKTGLHVVASTNKARFVGAAGRRQPVDELVFGNRGHRLSLGGAQRTVRRGAACWRLPQRQTQHAIEAIGTAIERDVSRHQLRAGPRDKPRGPFGILLNILGRVLLGLNVLTCRDHVP